jgi:hypothetical protein
MLDFLILALAEEISIIPTWFGRQATGTVGS